MAVEDVLAGLDFTVLPPVILCQALVIAELPDGRTVGPFHCTSPARHSITCMQHGELNALCSAHRIAVRPEDIVCGSCWYEAVIA